MKETGPQTHNPALEHLEVFVGDWEMKLSNPAFLSDPSATATGDVSFEWLENGAFLVLRMGNRPADTPDATWLIGRDESNLNYTVLYYDSRKVSRIYGMSFPDGIWNMWRNSPGFSQRFDGKLSRDGNTIVAAWEKSIDGKKWEHDFDITYTRIK